jgi:hypothetical protein
MLQAEVARLRRALDEADARARTAEGCASQAEQQLAARAREASGAMRAEQAMGKAQMAVTAAERQAESLRLELARSQAQGEQTAAEARRLLTELNGAKDRNAALAGELAAAQDLVGRAAALPAPPQRGTSGSKPCARLPLRRACILGPQGLAARA